MNLIKLTTILLAFFTFTAQESKAQESSLLWEITGKKVKSPSYLMGTMHLIPKDKFYFPEAWKEKLVSTDLLVMEIGGISEQMSVASLLFLKEGNLFDHFSQPQKDTLFQFLSAEMDYDSTTVKKQFGRMKPFALLQIITQSQFGEAPESYELTLELLAKEHKMEIAGLETAEQQMAIFDDMTISDQVEMVMASVRTSDQSATETNRLIEAFLSQDMDKLYEFMTEGEDSGLMSYEDELLTNRNIAWIPKIKKFIKKQPTFIAVGAGHLGGPQGVIELLRKEGYTLTPVK